MRADPKHKKSRQEFPNGFRVEGTADANYARRQPEQMALLAAAWLAQNAATRVSFSPAGGMLRRVASYAPNTSLMPENISATALADLTRRFALELAFVETGKDTGLLPLNNFLMQIEEALPASSAPATLLAAAIAVRRWLDEVFDTTALFDAPIIS